MSGARCGLWRRAGRWAAALGVAVCAALSAPAQAGGPAFCGRSQPLTAPEQARLLQFTGVVRAALAGTAAPVVLISRAGLDLSRFGTRYSHAALAWRDEQGAWQARQLYYACDEGRPRLYDQGLAGFVMGVDDPSQGYVSLVPLTGETAAQVRAALLDTPRALRLLSARYSANAYAFGQDYQNCNQWVAEMLATAWGDLPDGDDLRARAQQWLRTAGYAPAPVPVDSHWLMFAAGFVPLIHLRDHPEEDRYAMQLRVSLPASLEAFVRQRQPEAERTEFCHDGRQVVVRRGWTPIAEGCAPAAGDRVLPIDG